MFTPVRAFERAFDAGAARRIHPPDPVAVRSVRRGPRHMPREQATTGTCITWAKLSNEYKLMCRTKYYYEYKHRIS